ncbi:snw/ski-interacting protein [Quercus suber]|uniref:Snw/ski-interacting protein n=1 Tax=Quercus suber TaxID=58331 RepID=A0AAW0INW5_QUESU
MPADPLDPPKFKHKCLPKPSASASPPVPIMHSPPCPVTVKDQQDWKIPPCISNWINPKEHKAREAVAIRSKLQKEILMKKKERKEREPRALAQKARSERTASAAAALDTSDMMRIHYEHASVYEKEDHLPKETMEEQRMLREKVREERRRERERERRLEDEDAAIGKTKKSKIARDRDRDISEKVALCIVAMPCLLYI